MRFSFAQKTQATKKIENDFAILLYEQGGLTMKAALREARITRECGNLDDHINRYLVSKYGKGSKEYKKGRK